jgi:hypothetical protein
MTTNDDLLYAADPVRWSADLLDFTPDEWQKDFLRSSRPQLILNAHRQSGKSTCSAIKALHRAWFYRGSLVLMVSPSLRQSGELFRKTVDFLNMLPDRPRRLPEDNRTSLELNNGSRIVSLPGSEQTIRGFSKANLLIEDEASQVDDSTYKAVRPMLAISKGQLVLLSTPHGQLGHFYEEWTSGGPGWERWEVPVSQCTRIPAAFLASERRSLGLWFDQEYSCRFLQNQFSLFSPEAVDALLTDDFEPWP